MTAKTKDRNELAQRKPGAPEGNGNAAKHLLYSTKFLDRNKRERIRKRVARRLQGCPPEIRSVMRDGVTAMMQIEERIAVMESYLDANGIITKDGQPNRMLGEVRQYWALWLSLANANGMSLSSYMATRKDAFQGDALSLSRWANGDSQ